MRRMMNASSPWEERYAYTRRGSGGGRVPLADANHPAKPAHKHHLVKIGQAPVKMAAANALLLLQPSAVLVNWRQDNAAPRGDASIAICSARWARQAVHLAWTESMRRIIEGAQSRFSTGEIIMGKMHLASPRRPRANFSSTLFSSLAEERKSYNGAR